MLLFGLEETIFSFDSLDEHNILVVIHLSLKYKFREKIWFVYLVILEMNQYLLIVMLQEMICQVFSLKIIVEVDLVILI